MRMLRRKNCNQGQKRMQMSGFMERGKFKLGQGVGNLSPMI